MGGRGRRRKQLLDDLDENRPCCKLKEEALDRSVWGTGVFRGFAALGMKVAWENELCYLLIGFYNREGACLLRGTDWVFKICLAAQ